MKSFEEFGIAAFLPGMQYMIELMQQQIDGLRAQLSSIQNGKPRNIGNTRQTSESRSKKVSSYWAKMTEEERSAEVIRRRSVRSRNKAVATRKATWDKKTEAEKEAWKRAIQAGKKKKEKKQKKEAPAPKKAAVKPTVRLVA